MFHDLNKPTTNIYKTKRETRTLTRYLKIIRNYCWDFPGGPGAKISHSQSPNAEGLGSILGQETESHVMQLRPGRAK